MIELLLQAERAMSVGLVDRADVLYTQIAEADPQNSIAVVGLARVALERGDEPGALELARRALVIDPENAAASRMVERLEEVLRYREGAVADPDVTIKPETPPEEPADAGSVATEPAVTPMPQPEPKPLPELEAEPEPRPEPEPLPEPGSAPKRRSLLDRLLRLVRR